MLFDSRSSYSLLKLLICSVSLSIEYSFAVLVVIRKAQSLLWARSSSLVRFFSLRSSCQNFKRLKKEKLIVKIIEWITRKKEVSVEKEKLLKMMVEATLDYLYTNGYLDLEKEEKGNGEK